MTQNRYPGIGRLAHLLWSILLYLLVLPGILGALWLAMINGEGLSGEGFNWLWNMYGLMAYIGFAVAMIMLEVLRLRNLGMSGWWFLAKLVPVLNLWILWRMFVCPTGYADHKQLDLPGKIITALLVIIFVLPLLLSILGKAI